MTDEQIARIQLLDALNDLKTLTHELTEGELDELMNKHACLSKRVNSVI